MICRPLCFASFLAPAMLPVYEFIAGHVGRRLGLSCSLFVGSDYGELAEADVSFVCGLAYVELAERLGLEAVAAPVLRGERYGGRPVYFSDVIVRRDAPFSSFAELRGRSWSYNEPLSQSGYGITRYHLVAQGEGRGFFGRVVEAGFHDASIRMVAAGEVDASAIDSHVLALALRERPALAERVRVLASLGPSTIQPVAVRSSLPAPLKEDIQGVLMELAGEGEARPWLERGLLERFVAVDDGDYDDLRRMRRACAAAGLLTLC